MRAVAKYALQWLRRGYWLIADERLPRNGDRCR